MPGTVAVNGYLSSSGSPQSSQMEDGGTIHASGGWSFAGTYGLLTAKYPAAFAVWRNHTYTLDSRTGEFTDTETPGQTRIQVVFDPVTFTVETVDAAGNPLPGVVAVRPFPPNDYVYTSSPRMVPSPQSYTISSGGRIPAHYGFSFAGSYLHLTAKYPSALTIWRDHTYTLDSRTGEFTDTETPGETRIQVVFDPVTFTAETVDTAGNLLPGVMAVRPFPPNDYLWTSYLRWAPSPQSYTISSGGRIPGAYGFSFAGSYLHLTAKYPSALTIWRDHTYTLDSRTGEFTDTETPGETRIQVVFDPVTFTAETVDTAGNPLPGVVAVRPFPPNDNIWVSSPRWAPSPHSYTISSGGRIPTSYSFSFAGSYARLTAKYGPALSIWRDHTYTLDSRTGEFTDTETPGATAIQVVFGPPQVFVRTVDTTGAELAGQVTVQAVTSGWANSPFGFEAAEGTVIDGFGGRYGGREIHHGPLTVQHDNTYLLDVESRQLSVIASPGRTFIDIVFQTDDIAPITTIDLQGQLGEQGWYVSDVQITVLASDLPDPGASGVKEIRYVLDGGGEVVVTGDRAVFTIKAEGTHTLEAWAVDNAGNVGETAQLEAPVDTGPPTMTAEPQGPQGEGGYYRGDVTITYTGQDVGSGIDHVEYTFDPESGTWPTAPDGGVPVSCSIACGGRRCSRSISSR